MATSQGALTPIARLAFSLVVAFGTVPTVEAKATLRGEIRFGKRTGERAPNVRVTAGGAHDKASDKDGEFSMDFPEHAPGDRVELKVDREGYVVGNDWEVKSVVLPADARGPPLVIVLCQGAERAQCREDDLLDMGSRAKKVEVHGRQARVEAREREHEVKEKEFAKKVQEGQGAKAKLLRREGDDLRREWEELRREREGLRRELEQAVAQAAALARQLAPVEPERRSDAQERALRLLVDGKLAEAADLLKPHVPGTRWIGLMYVGQASLGRSPYAAWSSGVAATFLMESDPGDDSGSAPAYGLRLTGGWRSTEFRTRFLAPDGQALFIQKPRQDTVLFEADFELGFSRQSTVRPAIGVGVGGFWAPECRDCWVLGVPLHGRLAWTLSGYWTLVADLHASLEYAPAPSVRFTGFGAGLEKRERALGGAWGFSAGVER
jgi:hypothetical protein